MTSGPGEGEKYHVTHPVAIVAGILRGNPYATITESVRPPSLFRTVTVSFTLLVTLHSVHHHMYQPQW